MSKFKIGQKVIYKRDSMEIHGTIYDKYGMNRNMWCLDKLTHTQGWGSDKANGCDEEHMRLVYEEIPNTFTAKNQKEIEFKCQKIT